MLFQIESMWQILGWVLVFAGLIITNEIARQTKKGGIAPRTAHSLNPVPFIVYDKDARHELKEGTGFGLANVAPTVAQLLGLKPYDCWEESMLK